MADATGTLLLDHSSVFTGTVSGFNEDDYLDLADVLAGPETTITYSANASGAAGTLTVSDGTHTANISLNGQYSAEGFHLATDTQGGSLISYLLTPPPADQLS